MSNGTFLAIQYADDEAYKDQDFILTCMEVNFRAYVYLKEELRHEDEIVKRVYTNDPAELLRTLPNKILVDTFRNNLNPSLLKYFFQRCPASTYKAYLDKEQLNGFSHILFNILATEDQDYFITAFDNMDTSGNFTPNDHKLSKKKLVNGFDVTDKHTDMILFVLSKINTENIIKIKENLIRPLLRKFCQDVLEKRKITNIVHSQQEQADKKSKKKRKTLS